MIAGPETGHADAHSAIQRNWPGLLSIGLAAAGVALYMPAPGFFALGTAASFAVGIAAVLRARRGAGGLITAIVGLVIGGVLTVLWVAWIVGITLNPGALDD